jgi:hypothetical protein
VIKRHYPFGLIFVALLMATLACSLGGSKAVPLGETYRSDNGGFSLQKVPDFEFEEFWGMVYMSPADADDIVGPFIIAYGGLAEEPISIDDLLDQMKGEAEGAQFRDPKKTKIDGVEGYLVEFSGNEDGQDMNGKLFVATPHPQQEFYMTAIAPEARWKELEPIFDAVLKSVTFFEAEPIDFGLEDWEWDDEEDWDLVFEEDDPYLGDIYEHAYGFSFRQIAGYDLIDNNDTIVMYKSGLDAAQGGTFTIIYQVLPTPMTKDYLYDNPFGSSSMYHSQRPYILNEVDGVMFDFDETVGGEDVHGQVFLTLLSPTVYFNVFVEAPASEWENVQPIYEALLDSFEFSDDVAALGDQVQPIRQWAVWAEASSEYSSHDYSAMQATGAPDVDFCEENPLAWASAAADTEEYLVLHYETPVIPTELTIYQSHNPSQVVEIQFIDTDGETWWMWYGDPEVITSCPDVWTHTIELDETFYTDTVVIWVDQSVLGLGWVEIDAVELVGYPQGAVVASVPDEPRAEGPTGDVPTNYSGKMAGPVYQGWIDIVIGETMEADLDRIMTIEGRKSTDSWKPRESHKQTYLYDMPWAGMTAYISVTTDGWVYKKNVTSNTHPDDMNLTTVNRATYEELKAIYDRDKVIPYSVMANMLESPGFLREQWIGEEDGIVRSTYTWYNANGDRISGIFLDGRLTGAMGLNFIVAE